MVFQVVVGVSPGGAEQEVGAERRAMPCALGSQHLAVGCEFPDGSEGRQTMLILGFFFVGGFFFSSSLKVKP